MSMSGTSLKGHSRREALQLLVAALHVQLKSTEQRD